MFKEEFINMISNAIDNEKRISISMDGKKGNYVYTSFIPLDFEVSGCIITLVANRDSRYSFDISEISYEDDTYECGPDDNIVYVAV